MHHPIHDASNLLTFLTFCRRLCHQELEHYRVAFDARGYCNMTYIAEDLSEKATTAWMYTKEAATAAAIQTQDKAVYLAGEANVHGRRLAKEASIHAKTGYEVTKQFCIEQYQTQWPKIKPHFDQHVAPIVDKAVQWKALNIDPRWNHVVAEYNKIKTKEINPRLELFHRERKAMFVKMVATYASTCQESHRVLVDFTKERDLVEQFATIETAMKESCQRPEQSVTLALKLLLVLALLPFVSRIWGVSWFLVRILLRIFLTVTFLKFLLPRGGNNETTTAKVKRSNASTTHKSHGKKIKQSVY